MRTGLLHGVTKVVVGVLAVTGAAYGIFLIAWIADLVPFCGEAQIAAHPSPSAERTAIVERMNCGSQKDQLDVLVVDASVAEPKRVFGGRGRPINVIVTWRSDEDLILEIGGEHVSTQWNAPFSVRGNGTNPGFTVNYAYLGTGEDGRVTFDNAQSSDDAMLESNFWFGDCNFMERVAASLTDSQIWHRVERDLSISYRNSDSDALKAVYDPMVSDYVTGVREDRDYSCRPEVPQKLEAARQSRSRTPDRD